MDLEAYFTRIGFNGERAPTLATLRELHQAHAHSIAFENLNPLLGWQVPLDLPSLEDKLVRSHRGGYCFEQNALLAAALRQLGFNVTGLGARVLWNAPEDAIRMRGHMLLKVDIDGEPHIADVGFGGLTLTGPLRLVTDVEQATPHERFRLVMAGSDYKLQGFVAGAWKSLYRFDLQPQREPDYEVSSYFMSTHPTSHFRSAIVVARPVPGGRYALSNNQLTMHHLDGPSERRVLAGVAEVREVLETVFGLALPPTDELDPALARACSFQT
ncbi:MAG: arylamine N-acetyltransferase [Gammaproteobacteria bacterium]